jgi:hypothetical protein
MLVQEAQKKYGSNLARSVAENADAVLIELEQSARRHAEEAMTSIFLRADAVALADALGGQPLADAEEAHAPFGQAVKDAEKALAEARTSWMARTMELMKRHTAEDGTEMPKADSTPVERAWQALAEAQNIAEETGRHLQFMREKIKRLRAIPEPNPSDVVILAGALHGSKG